MAGRGTDIVLGGSIVKPISLVNLDDSLSPEQKAEKIAAIRAEWAESNAKVKAAGGLRIIGTERHESRRIDNQLRGRAGRQGDPGSSRFYLSLDDSLMRIFAGDRVRGLMERLGTPGEPIEARMVSRSIESAQRKVESRNFDIRKQLLEFDNVANDQRKVLYGQRNEVLEESSVREMVEELRYAALNDLVRQYVPEESMEEQWDLASLQTILSKEWAIEINLQELVAKNSELDDEDIFKAVFEEANRVYESKIAIVGEESWNQFERSVLLDRLDTAWREHLAALDHLRQGIHLRGYAQKDPKQEYKKEAFQLFQHMLERVRDETARVLLTVQIRTPEQVEEVEAEQVARAQEQQEKMKYHHSDFDEALAGADEQEDTAKAAGTPAVNEYKNVGRNDPCPCGSGKKFKQCHGKLV